MELKIDRRFAIVVGIDNYTNKTKLDYAVKDAQAVKNVLINNCLFKEEDVYLIYSNDANPINDVTGHLMSSLEAIQKTFIPNESSVLFYFAGHGEYHFTESTMVFHDSLFPIAKIFEALNNLSPKFLTCIIDACESGSKVLTRGQIKHSNNIEKYINSSSGALFMYACQASENAHELENIGHGLFTHHLLKAFEEKNDYDNDGVLIPDKIAIYVRKNTMDDSNFKQTPVVEIRATGYYPLAFSEEVLKNHNSKTTTRSGTPKKKKENTKSTVEKGTALNSFPVINSEIRKSNFQSLEATLKDNFNKFCKEFKTTESYEIKYSFDFSSLPSEVYDKTVEEIVTKSKTKKIKAAGEIFTTSQEPINNQWLKLSFMDSFLNSSPKYHTIHRINFDEENVLCASFFLDSKDVYTPSSGFGFLIYQAIYGIGATTFVYNMDWNGYGNDILVGPKLEIKAYKYSSDVITKIDSFVKELFGTYSYGFEATRAERKKEIDTFERLAD